MFFNKKEDKEEESYLIRIGALLIHAAKIDEQYTTAEEDIIKKTLLELGADKNQLELLIVNAKKREENSYQILDFTKEVKKLDEKEKIKIVKSLWKIIYSNKDADIYETSLMRRLSGLLYIDSKIMGDIKEEIKNKYS
jgi:uncharacterized tellurite resistance protein B-like protein|tara:strand:+ start:1210 stop:1623 length:414 start_codon:yes stop_codon:yes gene_type:complete